MKLSVAIIMILTLCSPTLAKVMTRQVDYRHEGALFKGYLAYDDVGEEKRPGVLVVHEWWGLNDYIKDCTRKLAEHGYIAFAVDNPTASQPSVFVLAEPRCWN